MMNEREKSDLATVAEKLANKVAGATAEPMEPRARTKGKTTPSTTCRTQRRESVSPGLDRLRQAVQKHRNERFTALFHHITVDLLRESYRATKRDAAAGVDGVTWSAYGVDLEDNLADLHSRVHSGAYRAQPSRRRMIPKPDGRERPLGIASLEDKIVQRAVAEILTIIYEAEFYGFSYGFRPGRNQHDALDALFVGIDRMAVNWILDADIRAFFDTVNHEWMMRMLEHRIGDQRILRLIRKWLKAGVMEDGTFSATEVGTPQGSTISPLMANIYLHYCFDMWAERWRKRHARGRVIIVRFADDIVCGFEHEAEAQAFHVEMKARMGKFALSLHPEKTRLLEFGRYAAQRRTARGLGKPETFTFLGFTHICGRNRRGAFQLVRFTRRDRMRATLKAIKEKLRQRMHQPIPEQGTWLRKVVKGYFAYHAIPTNTQTLSAFRYVVMRMWRHALRRRSQTDRMTWKQIARLADQWLPMPHIMHPWPGIRFAVKYPRWEPCALIAPARFCTGGA